MRLCKTAAVFLSALLCFNMLCYTSVSAADSEPGLPEDNPDYIDTENLILTLGARPNPIPSKPYSPTNYLLFYTEKDSNNNPITTVPGEYYYSTPSVSYEIAMLGDINDDGLIDIKDAVLEARIEENDPTLSLTRKQYLAADVNVDLFNNSLDTSLLMRYLARTVSHLFDEGVFYDNTRSDGGDNNS